MENILDDVELMDEKNLLFSIWTKPTKTFDFILKRCPRKYVNALINCSGLAGALGANVAFLLNHVQFSIALIILIAGLGWLFAWLWVYLFASLLSWTGRWIGGRGEMDQFVTVLAWSYVPVICSLVPLILEEIAFGEGRENIDITGQNIITTGLYYLFLVINTGLSIWSFIILVRGTAVLQKFAIGKTILNIILPVLVILTVILAILGLIYIF